MSLASDFHSTVCKIVESHEVEHHVVKSIDLHFLATFLSALVPV